MLLYNSTPHHRVFKLMFVFFSFSFYFYRQTYSNTFWSLGYFFFAPYQNDFLPTVIGEKTVYTVNTNRKQIIGYVCVCLWVGECPKLNF